MSAQTDGDVASAQETREESLFGGIHLGFWAHPKANALVRTLGFDHETISGHLNRFWQQVQITRPDGALDGWLRLDVDVAANWGKKNRKNKTGTAFADALIEHGWIDVDDDGVMHCHDWAAYAGRAVTERADRRKQSNAASSQRRRDRLKLEEEITKLRKEGLGEDHPGIVALTTRLARLKSRRGADASAGSLLTNADGHADGQHQEKRIQDQEKKREGERAPWSVADGERNQATASASSADVADGRTDAGADASAAPVVTNADASASSALTNADDNGDASAARDHAAQQNPTNAAPSGGTAVVPRAALAPQPAGSGAPPAPKAAAKATGIEDRHGRPMPVPTVERRRNRDPVEMEAWRETPEEILQVPLSAVAPWLSIKDPDPAATFGRYLSDLYKAYDGVRGRPTILLKVQSKWEPFKTRFFAKGPKSAFAGLIEWMAEGYHTYLGAYERSEGPILVVDKPPGAPRGRPVPIIVDPYPHLPPVPE